MYGNTMEYDNHSVI